MQLRSRSRAMEPREPCQAGNRAALSGMFHVPRGRRFRSCIRRTFSAQEVVPCIRPCTANGGPRHSRMTSASPYHRDAAKAGGGGPHLPRLPLHRHPGHRQDHLRQDPGQGRQLRAPGGRGSLLPVPVVPWHRERQLSGRDGAGRRLQHGVDQVRALRDEAIYAPANVKKRVYIVDEVHMLSVPAFNALLKIWRSRRST